MDFDLIDQEQVDDAELLVDVMDDDGPPARGVREELAVRDMQGAAIGHVDGERAERSGLMHVAELFDRRRAPSPTAVLVAVPVAWTIVPSRVAYATPAPRVAWTTWLSRRRSRKRTGARSPGSFEAARRSPESSCRSATWTTKSSRPPA